MLMVNFQRIEKKQLGRGLRTYKGKEFLALIETTDMAKVYKMPVLYSFYDAFRDHMNDILEYRTMDYYRRRYEKE